MQRTDLTGQAFGRLTVLGPAPSAHTKTYWRCRCECGQVCTVQTANLRNAITRSCGCLKRETWLEAYILWKHIIQRCENPNTSDYLNYGGRDIRIAPYWRHDFATFRADLLSEIGPKPSGYHSLDRTNNDGHYERGNLRWSMPIAQMNNQRKTRYLTLNNQTHTIREWAVITGLPYAKLASRVYAGWSDHRALTQPLHKRVDAPGRYKSKLP
jgi:hypothetical protein